MLDNDLIDLIVDDFEVGWCGGYKTILENYEKLWWKLDNNLGVGDNKVSV